ncbi:MAG: ABC transporter permease [Hydrogenophilales bacterium CG_4_10_14_3_um_filter_63_21]|nr:MAG: ABC transporter permease [Hydrogenophilales bacterium CG_4_10_14_3_um_filter_63_21]
MRFLSLRFLTREWRAGEIRVLLLAVALAVASLTAVAFFGDRVKQALGREANTLLAADLALVSDHPLAPAFAVEARRRGLRVSSSAAFLSMALAGDRNLLSGIKGVAPGYPLRGSLRIAAAPFAADAPTRALPGPGQVWLDARAANELGVRVGGEVELGSARFQVAAILTFEGERGGNFMALAPRVLLAAADLEKTGLVREGSRVSYRLLLAGTIDAVAAYQAWCEPRMSRGEKLEDVRDARPELRQILDKAQRYLGLAAVLTVVLAAAATHLALRRYVQRHFDQYALMRCFGASQRRLLGLYFLQLAGLGLAAGLLGAALGWITQLALANLLGEVLRLGLPAASWQPFGLGLLAGVALILAFALPPMLRLARVLTLRVLRRELDPPRSGAVLAHLAGLLLVAGLIFWQAGEVRLALIASGGVLVVMALAAASIQAMLWPLSRLARHLRGNNLIGLRLGLIGLRQRGWETTLQAMALSLGLLALLLLTLVRGDLLDAWRDQVPAGAPNRFVINIQPEQVAPVRAWLERNGVRGARLYPMIRARLGAIAGHPVRPSDYPEGRARTLAEREFNLSELAELPPDNELAAGHWWRPGQTTGFTVEAGLADILNIHLGDLLDFDVGGLPLSGRVISLRKVKWDSFRVNFFVATPRGALDALPKSYITSFHLPPRSGAELAGLIAAFPGLTVIDVAQVINELRALTDRVSQAVQLVFLFSLGVGVLVMLAAIYSRRSERAREIGLWRALGASKRTLRAALASEFALLGLLAGLVAAGAASVLAWVLANQVFDLPHSPDPWVWLFGLAGGMVLVLLAGWLATRDLLEEPPLRALRLE